MKDPDRLIVYQQALEDAERKARQYQRDLGAFEQLVADAVARHGTGDPTELRQKADELKEKQQELQAQLDDLTRRFLSVSKLEDA